MLVRSPKALGALIRNRRRELGLDQAELGRRVGSTRHWIIGVEKGKPTVELGRVLRTLEVLDLDLDARPRSVQSEAPARRPRRASVPTVDIDSIVRRAKQRK